MTRMPALLLPALAMVAGLSPAAQAQAQASARGDALCGERLRIVDRLQAAYGETRRGYGLQQGASVVEVYASDKTGSWTILATSPTGISCLVASGRNWAPEAVPVGDPA